MKICGGTEGIICGLFGTGWIIFGLFGTGWIIFGQGGLFVDYLGQGVSFLDYLGQGGLFMDRGDYSTLQLKGVSDMKSTQTCAESKWTPGCKTCLKRSSLTGRKQKIRWSPPSRALSNIVNIVTKTQLQESTLYPMFSRELRIVTGFVANSILLFFSSLMSGLKIHLKKMHSFWNRKWIFDIFLWKERNSTSRCISRPVHGTH